MKRFMEFFLLLIATDITLAQSVHYEDDHGDQEDYIYDYDPCNFYDDHSEANEDCKNEKFSKLPHLKKIFGPKAQTCCDKQAYLYHDKCEGRPRIHGMEVCGLAYDHENPEKRAIDVFKLDLCHMERKKEEEFIIDKNGDLKLKDNSTEVQNYCVGYECSPDDMKWHIIADVSFCYKDDLGIKKVDAIIPKEYPRCCNETRMVQLDAGMWNENLICPISEHIQQTESNAGLRHCKGHQSEWLEASFETMNMTNSTRQISFSHEILGLEIEEAHDDVQYCVGVTKNLMPGVIYDGNYRPSLMYCHQRCRGVKPCLNICCKPEEMWNGTDCIPMKNGTTIEDYLLMPIFKRLGNLNLENLEKPTDKYHNGICPEGYKPNNEYLRPHEKCSDHFDIDLDQNGIVTLVNVLKRKASDANTTHFCVNFEDNLEISVLTCVAATDESKLKPYSNLLIASSVFLLLTFVIYSYWSKLLNYYTRVVRHYVVNMFFAFVLLSINQKTFLGDLSHSLCVVTAFLLQYFFLAAFSFMSVMGVEVSLLMRGEKGNSKRYRKQMIIGYSIPISLTLITLIVEFTAPKCSPIRPKFGDTYCFFADYWSKLLWFHLPVAGVLLVNFIMFVKAVLSLLKLKREHRRFHLTSSENRETKMENFLLYLKLFLGMGFIWVFEILAGVTHTSKEFWYFTDVLNMCTGFYVFWAFVCKRNVFKIIFKTGTPQQLLLRSISNKYSAMRKLPSSKVKPRKLESTVNEISTTGTEVQGDSVNHTTGTDIPYDSGYHTTGTDMAMNSLT